jgi:Tfp pilus assembly protein PilZ
MIVVRCLTRSSPSRRKVPVVEQRRFARAPFREDVVFIVKGSDARSVGITRDLGLGGVFVETAAPAAFGAELVVHLHLPGEPSAFALPGVVRWVRSDGMGVQFGMLGARETFAITEIVRQVQQG